MKGRNIFVVLGMGLATMLGASSAMAVNGAVTGAMNPGLITNQALSTSTTTDVGSNACKAGEIYRGRPTGIAHTRTPGKGGGCIRQTCVNTKVDANNKVTCYN